MSEQLSPFHAAVTAFEIRLDMELTSRWQNLECKVNLIGTPSNKKSFELSRFFEDAGKEIVSVVHEYFPKLLQVATSNRQHLGNESPLFWTRSQVLRQVCSFLGVDEKFDETSPLRDDSLLVQTTARIALNVGWLDHAIPDDFVLPGWVDTSGLTIPMLRAKVRRYKKEFGMKFAIVDYVGLMDAPGRDETQRGTAIAKGLQRIAHDEGIALVALSQLRRPQNKNPNERPTKEWLRWSGDYEANADVVLLIHRPKDLQTSTYTKRDWIILGKARDGAVGAIPVIYDEDHLMFFGREREEGE